MSNVINWEGFVTLTLETNFLRLVQLDAEWQERSIREQRREAIRRAEELLANYRQQIMGSEQSAGECLDWFAENPNRLIDVRTCLESSTYGYGVKTPGEIIKRAVTHLQSQGQEL